jgi:hypothetical protein
MYEIFAYPYGDPENKLTVYQPGNRQAVVLSPKLTREVSKGGSLTFTMLRTHPCYESMQKMSTAVAVHQDGKEIWRGRVLSHEADWLNRRVIYCEGALSYFNDSCITPFNYEGKLRDFLEYLIKAHNSQISGGNGYEEQTSYDKMKKFELGRVTAALGDLVVSYGDRNQYGVGEDYGSTWDIISKMVLKTYGGYAYCTYNSTTGMNVLNYCDQAYEADRQTAQNIEYGVNLLDFTEKTDTNDLFTRIWPMGNKHTVEETKTQWKYKFLWFKWGSTTVTTGTHEERYGINGTSQSAVDKYLPKKGYSWNREYGWIQNDEAVKKFGVVSKIREFDTDSSDATFAAAVQDLEKNDLMTMSYEVKAVDLVDAGYDTERLTFASFAHIISKPHSIDVIMLCTKLVEPLDHPEKKEYTFGMTRRTLTDRAVANLGVTNELSEKTASTSRYASATQVDTTQAGKTASDFIDYAPSTGMTVGHASITANIHFGTDGLTFSGVKNGTELQSWSGSTFAAQTTSTDLSGYAAVLLTYDGDAAAWAAAGGRGRAFAVLPVNGKTYSILFPGAPAQRRDVTASKSGVTFGSGYRQTAAGAWVQDDTACRPEALQGFM